MYTFFRVIYPSENHGNIASDPLSDKNWSTLEIMFNKSIQILDQSVTNNEQWEGGVVENRIGQRMMGQHQTSWCAMG